MNYTRMDDFKNPETGRYDWERYNKAQRENGEKCIQCGAFIIFAAGYPRNCAACDAMSSNRNEVEHNSRIRCPGCGHSREVEDLYEAGEHSVRCSWCEREFSVETKISFSFVSPKRIAEPDEEEDEGDAA